MSPRRPRHFFFFLNDRAPPEIYTLPLPDALPISAGLLPQVRSGAIKPYAVMANRRLAAAPDIPTVDEAGLPGLHISTWYALFAPKSTPKPIIARSEEHTSELQSQSNLVCRLLLEK